MGALFLKRFVPGKKGWGESEGGEAEREKTMYYSTELAIT